MIPWAGALITRNKWRRFRNLFNDLRQSVLLNYSLYRQLKSEDLKNENNIFRFTGEIESITDGHTLWVRGENLTIPVSLEKTKCFLVPQQPHAGLSAAEGIFSETPVLIRWNTICTLTEGAKVFIGGKVEMLNNRLSFCSSKENPLMAIFYNCNDDDLPREIISGARTRWDYWNPFTPISLAAGALSLFYLAASLLGRPAFHLTVITAIIAVFIPILPIIPPGLLLTALYQRLTLFATNLRANWDLLKFGFLPDTKQKIKRRFDIRAYGIEITAWIILLSGIFINIIFIFIILLQFKVITL